MPQETEGLLSPLLRHQRYSHAAHYVSREDIVLDVGCGGGGFQRYLPAHTEYFGIDVEKHWREKSDHFFIGSVERSLPSSLRRQKFSVVTALAVIEHLERPEMLFSAAQTLLPVGGKILLTTPHPVGRLAHDLGARVGIFSKEASEEHKHFFNKKSLQHIAEKHHFELLDFRYFLCGFNQLALFSKKR